MANATYLIDAGGGRRERITLCVVAALVAAALCVSAYTAAFLPQQIGPETVLLIGMPLLLGPFLYHAGYKMVRAQHRALARNRALQAELLHEAELRRQAEATVENTQELDEVSGVATRRLFLSRAETAMARSRRTDRPVSICLMSVNNFEKMHRSLGQETCNQILAKLGDVCRSCLREIDLPARLDDDVIGLLFEDTTALDASRALRRLRDEIRAVRSWTDGRLVKLSVNFGLIQLDAHQHILEDALEWAGTALEHAQESGANRICIARDANPQALKVA